MLEDFREEKETTVIRELLKLIQAAEFIPFYWSYVRLNV